jgi:hypothetical protein
MKPERNGGIRWSDLLGACDDLCEWIRLCLLESVLTLKLKLADFHVALLQRALQLRDAGFKPGKLLLFWERNMKRLDLPDLFFVVLFVAFHKCCVIDVTPNDKAQRRRSGGDDCQPDSGGDVR